MAAAPYALAQETYAALGVYTEAALRGRPRLAQTKPRALVVNTSRGKLIDTQALATLLEAGHPL